MILIPTYQLQKIDLGSKQSDFSAALAFLESRPDELKLLQSCIRAPEHKGWRYWVTEKTEHTAAGKWTTRFQKEWKKTHGSRMDPGLLADLGEKVRAANIAEVCYVEFTMDINWKAGSFGDSGSCWFNEKHKSYKFRDRFFGSGRGFAMKFFQNEDAYRNDPFRGTGRSWVSVNDTHAFVFNGRGGSVTTQIAARAMSAFLKKPYVQRQFTLKDCYTDGVTYMVGESPYPDAGIALEF